MATGLTEDNPQRDPEEQDMRSAWLSRSEIERLITDGTVSDAKSVAAFALLLLREATPRPTP